ncbi:MAG TPA: hypothetical protein VH813_02960 [Candidatus Limnocylindrales bacterium]
MTSVGRDPVPAGPLPSFAHASEAEMARILDFYAVRWEYEPHTFPILWSLDGSVVESFAPDFYLPDLDLYLEMTTLKQRLVRKKNRKLRRLRELYPDLRIKLFYARDFRMLMLKYGKLALLDTLSGTPGQVVPARVAEPAAGILAAATEAAASEAEALLDSPPAPAPEPVPAVLPLARAAAGARPLAGAARPRRRRRSHRAPGGPATRR